MTFNPRDLDLPFADANSNYEVAVAAAWNEYNAGIAALETQLRREHFADPHGQWPYNKTDEAQQAAKRAALEATREASIQRAYEAYHAARAVALNAAREKA